MQQLPVLLSQFTTKQLLYNTFDNISLTSQSIDHKLQYILHMKQKQLKQQQQQRQIRILQLKLYLQQQQRVQEQLNEIKDKIVSEEEILSLIQEQTNKKLDSYVQFMQKHSQIDQMQFYQKNIQLKNQIEKEYQETLDHKTFIYKYGFDKWKQQLAKTIINKPKSFLQLNYKPKSYQQMEMSNM